MSCVIAVNHPSELQLGEKGKRVGRYGTYNSYFQRRTVEIYSHPRMQFPRDSDIINTLQFRYCPPTDFKIREYNDF